MRILHVMPSLARSYGGPVHALLGYLQAGQTAGVEAEVAAPAPSPEDARWLAESAGAAGFHFFRAAGHGAFVVAPGLWRWLRAAAGRYDVVHVHGLFNPVSSVAARVALGGPAPVLLRPFGTLSRYTFTHRRSALKRAYFRRLDGPNLRRAAGVHFATEGESAEAARWGIDLRARGYIVPPPYLVGSSEPTAQRRAGSRVLFLSRLHPVKHVELLLDAWPRVLRDVPDAVLTLAGSGDAAYVAGLRERAARLGIADRLELPGFVQGPEKARLLASASLFVLPSFHENFGMAVLEALAAGLPAVVTPEVELAALVREHDLGRLLAQRSPESLARAIVGALGDAGLRARCAERGPRLVRECFSPAAIGRDLARMYATVTAAGSGAAAYVPEAPWEANA